MASLQMVWRLCFFQEHIFQVVTAGKAGVTNSIKNSWIALRGGCCRVLILCTLTPCQWLNGTSQWKRHIINVISSTCSSPSVPTRQNVGFLREKRPFRNALCFLGFCGSTADIDTATIYNLKGKRLICVGGLPHSIRARGFTLFYTGKTLVDDAVMRVTPPIVAFGGMQVGTFSLFIESNIFFYLQNIIVYYQS